MFVGVVITTYNREKEKLGKNFLLTESQKKWLEVRLLLVEAKPKYYIRKPKSSWRVICFKIVQQPWIVFDKIFYSENAFIQMIL